MALADELRWGRAVAVAMHALGGEASVADLANHPLLQVKYAAQPLKTTLTSRITSVLANHTVGDSTTVVSARRVGEAFFDKRPDTASTWFLASALSDELIDASSQVTAPARPEEANNYTFLTFHQAYGYEDFIEGIRPIMAAADPDEGGALAYSLEPGAFMKAAQAAVRLAGFSGTLHELCSLPRERRRQLFDGAAGYAVFIDEINRGNVSRIFGELITLLEPDKRLGAENEIIVSLPYSKRRFGVPPNIHVIGTMNTADRSVEALDTALRRRFEFEELVPDLEQLDFEIDNEIEVDKMLRAINHRIEKLYDRDHCIGHAYLLPLKEEPTLEALKLVFKHRIIPLLQEYFFGDWGKIGLVLGEAFVQPHDLSKTQFANFDHGDREALAERHTWRLVDLERLTNQDFQRIYADVPKTA